MTIMMSKVSIRYNVTLHCYSKPQGNEICVGIHKVYVFDNHETMFSLLNLISKTINALLILRARMKVLFL